jgi:hypothetical protein
MWMDRQPAALTPLPPPYRDLFARLLDVAAADDRVLAVWLSGSVGRGVADAGSDLDVVLTVTDEAATEFAAEWRGWLGRVTPTVLARDLPRLPGSWYSLTPGCERLDVVTERAGRRAPLPLADRVLVLDRDGRFAAEAAEPEPAAEPRDPDPARVLALTEEFLRQQAIFPAAVVARRDWLLGIQGVEAMHLLLYELFVEANQPLPKMGLKQWSAKLSPPQRDCLAALPLPRAEPRSVQDAMHEAAAVFRREARQILAGNGVPWPSRLDDAVLGYQSRELGWWAARPGAQRAGSSP